MKRIFLSLLFAIGAFGQTRVDLTTQVKVHEYTIATLPAAPPVGTLATVTDGNGTDCITGSLFGRQLCQYDSGWKLVTGFIDNSIVYAATFGVVSSTTRFNNDATTVNGSNLLNAPTLGCVASDAGKLAIVVKPVNNTYPFGTGLVTVLSCNSPTQAVLSGNAGANAGAAQNWAIGPANGTALNAAATAAWNAGKAISVPCGAMIVESPPFVTAASYNWSQSFNVTGCIGTVGSLFILHPNITVGVLANGSFFYKNGTLTGYAPVGGSDFDVTNIRLTSFGGGIPMAAGQMSAFLGTGSSLRLHGVQIHELWSANAANCVFIANGGGESYYDLLNLQHSNCNYIAFAGQGANTLSNSILAYNTGAYAVFCGATVTCNLETDYVTNTTGIQGFNGATISVTGGVYNQYTGFNALGAASRLNLNGIVNDVPGPGFSQSNIDTTNMSVYAVNSKFTNESNATPNIFKGTGSVFDVGGNTASNTNGPIMNAATALFGSASITGTALVAGNVGLTSGWDTSTVTAVGAGSDSHKGAFTITAAGAPGLNPRITLTFPTPFWTAPVYCTLQQTGGTLGVLTVPLNSAGTPTLTAVTFDLVGTPVAAQTYIFSYGCP